MQEKEIERVGASGPIRVDIRVIAATHRELESLITEGAFREDLYFRLNVFPIRIPPLRQRKGDIPALVHHFIEKKCREMNLEGMPSLAPKAVQELMAYSWPGNVRELENAVERALILGRGKGLVFDDLHPFLKPTTPFGREAAPEMFSTAVPDGSLGLDGVISRHIRRVLEMTRGKVGGTGGAAHLLGVNPSTLRKRMRKLGIPFGRKRIGD